MIEVHIADLHFGAPNVDPLTEYNILVEQFCNKIQNIKFDLLSINGDIFHRKFQSTSDAIRYALMFVAKCASICRDKKATLIIIGGTHSHDADQFNLLYQFYEDRNLDIRIIEQAQFIYVKDARILCLPEEYGKPKNYYRHFLYESGVYDAVFMHGTLKGSIYGMNEENLGSVKAPVFSLDSFRNCLGPVIAGHVHVAGCYEKYMYYCSSPIRFQFGEEEDKGFIVLLHNLDTRMHYVHYETIESFRYDTVEISEVQYSDPQAISNYINALLANDIHFVRIQFNGIVNEVKEIVKAHYKNNSRVTFKDDADKKNLKLNTTEEIVQKYKDISFILDPNLSEFQKFVQYINYNKGSDYITVEKLKEILSSTKI